MSDEFKNALAIQKVLDTRRKEAEDKIAALAEKERKEKELLERVNKKVNQDRSILIENASKKINEQFSASILKSVNDPTLYDEKGQYTRNWFSLFCDTVLFFDKDIPKEGVEEIVKDSIFHALTHNSLLKGDDKMKEEGLKREIECEYLKSVRVFNKKHTDVKNPGSGFSHFVQELMNKKAYEISVHVFSLNFNNLVKNMGKVIENGTIKEIVEQKSLPQAKPKQML